MRTAYLNPWKILLLSLCVSCWGKHYVTRDFSFSQDAVPHEPGWKYHGTVKITLSGAWGQVNEKDIKIIMRDRFGRHVILDHFQLEARGVSSEIVWAQERNLVIELYEEE